VKQPVRFTIDGRTSDIGAYTRFLRNLAASPWVGAVVPGANRTVVEDDKALTAFSITATFVQADSAFIRTVSVAESVR
jgi:Tfp pilus assembly protein PilN